MRVSVAKVAAIAVMLAATGAPVALAQGRVPAIATASMDLLRQGQASLAANKPAEALDLLEAAVLADPRNGMAYVTMGRAYEALGLPGRAMRYYRQALTLNPNDTAALEAQAIGFAQRGMADQAQLNVQRLRRLCGNNGCGGALTRVDAALAKAATKGPATAAAAPARPAVPAARN